MKDVFARISPRPVRPGWLLAGLILAYLALAVAYNFADPLFEPPDETLHYDLVRYLQQHRALPVVRLEDPPSEYHQPPAYYSLAALLTAWIPADDYPGRVQRNPFWAYDIGAVGRDNKNQFLHPPGEAVTFSGAPLAIRLVRLLSTLAGAACLYLAYHFVLNLFPGRTTLALVVSAVVGFTPNFLLTTSAVSNDAFIAMLPVGVMLYMLRLHDQADPPTRRQWLTLSLLIGGSMLVKSSAWPLTVVSAVLAGILAWRHRARRPAWRAFVTAGVTLLGGVLLLTGWWFARNLMLYGELTGYEQMWRVWGVRPPLTLGRLLSEAELFRNTYWANFGYGNIPMPPLVYRVLDGLSLLGLAGLIWRGVEYARARERALPPAKLLLLGVWFVVTWAALFWYLQRTQQVTGRQIYALLPLHALGLVWGLARWVPRRWHHGLAPGGVLAMLGLALGALGGVLIPAYAPAPRLPLERANTLPHRLDWQLDELTWLRGYALSTESVRPGETLLVTLYWEPMDASDRPYTLFVHLLDENGQPVSQRDTYPGLGHDPTIYWRPGMILVDAVPVPVPSDLTGPTSLRLAAGLYDLETFERMPILAPGGQRLEAMPVFATLELEARP